MKEEISSALHYMDRLTADPYRPRYHFAIPADDGNPGDPNGAFFADGIYHLMYLYRNGETNAYHWGHLTSSDLLHWQRHRDALTVENGDEGCFSGGAFVDEDGTAYLSFWKFPSKNPSEDRGGIQLAKARPPYEEWTRLEEIAVESDRDHWGVTTLKINGEDVWVGSADPSNIFRDGKYYYMETGNKLVLDLYGDGENAIDEYRGGWTDLFRSEDLKTWTYLHRFYEHTWTGENGWPDATEDDMCPQFLPLFDAPENGAPTGKWLQTFIAHNRGCQYLAGTWADEHFTPEVHGRMTWNDNTYFAPEALVDDRNRQILWAWLLDNPADDFKRFGWSGVYSFPRTLWWKDGMLHMAPASELTRLERNPQTFDVLSSRLPVKDGQSFRMRLRFAPGTETVGVRIREDAERGEYTDILVDRVSGKLIFDATHSGCEGRRIQEEAPLSLRENENTELDIFVDRSVVEVYANERQAICRRVFPTDPEKAVGVTLIGPDRLRLAAEVSRMMPTNLY